MRLRIWRRAAPEPVLEDECAAGAEIAALYERDAARLRRRFGGRMCPEKAADMVQTVFVRLLGLGPARLRKIDKPFAYMARAAENLARNEFKSAGHRLHDDVDVGTIEAPSSDPHRLLEARDLLRRVEAAIPSLPERTRDIFVAHRFEGMTYGEIAQRMGLSVKTVEKHISLALRELQQLTGSGS